MISIFILCLIILVLTSVFAFKVKENRNLYNILTVFFIVATLLSNKNIIKYIL